MAICGLLGHKQQEKTHRPGQWAEMMGEDFPGGIVDGNPPANSEDTGSSLVQGDSTCCRAAKALPRLLEPTHSMFSRSQLMGPCATTTEAVDPEFVLHSKRIHQNENNE